MTKTSQILDSSKTRNSSADSASLHDHHIDQRLHSTMMVFDLHTNQPTKSVRPSDVAAVDDCEGKTTMITSGQPADLPPTTRRPPVQVAAVGWA